MRAPLPIQRALGARLQNAPDYPMCCSDTHPETGCSNRPTTTTGSRFQDAHYPLGGKEASMVFRTPVFLPPFDQLSDLAVSGRLRFASVAHAPGRSNSAEGETNNLP